VTFLAFDSSPPWLDNPDPADCADLPALRDVSSHRRRRGRILFLKTLLGIGMIRMAASEDFIDSTVANLKVIGMVPQNGRLRVCKGQLCLESTDNVQGVRRWLRGDSRDLTLVHVRNAINNAKRVVMLSSGCIWTLCRIATELEQCEVGLQNLRATYMADSAMMANLGVVIERIVSYRAQLLRDYPDMRHGINGNDNINGNEQDVSNRSIDEISIPPPQSIALCGSASSTG
jgi:hypothetical protein